MNAAFVDAGPRWPPPFTVRMVPPGDDPVALAIDGARSGALGAADALWTQTETTLRMALITEPDVPLAEARVLRAMVQRACVLALAALLPALVAMGCDDAGRILVNAGELGHVALHAPEESSDADVPAWLIAALVLERTRPGDGEGGEAPHRAVLAEEGGAHLAAEEIVAEMLRHVALLMAHWRETGALPPPPGWLLDPAMMPWNGPQ